MTTTAQRDRFPFATLTIDGKPVEPQRAKVGDVFNTERLGPVRILVLHGVGTVDVEARDGRCYRITGLPCTVFG